MHRVDTSTNVTVLPAPKPAGTPGYFSEGNESSGAKATYPGPDFFNSLQEEVVAPILAAGLTLSKSDNTQLLQAIIALAKSYGFSTGDAKITYKSVADTGWVMVNDGSIGSAASGATTRANADTLALYTLLWTNINNTWAPVSGGRGASAAADFAANKTLTLPRQLGRAIAVAGAGAALTSRALGEYLGAETHVLTIAEMPSHDHASANYSSGVGSNTPLAGGNGVTNATSAAVSQGGGAAHNNMPPESFMNVMIKL